jgi:hypothetical protein
MAIAYCNLTTFILLPPRFGFAPNVRLPSNFPEPFQRRNRFYIRGQHSLF